MTDTNDLLHQMRKIVREEVEAEAKITRQENSLSWVSVSSKVERVENRLKNVEISNSRLEQGQARLETAGEALKAGQDDIREQLETKTEKADIQDLKAEVVKKIKDHETRIDDLEKEVGLPHPHKH